MVKGTLYKKQVNFEERPPQTNALWPFVSFSGAPSSAGTPCGSPSSGALPELQVGSVCLHRYGSPPRMGGVPWVLWIPQQKVKLLAG